MSRMPVVRSSLLFPQLRPQNTPRRSMGHPHAHHTEIERPRRHHSCVCIASQDPRNLLTFFTAVTVVSPRMGESGWPFASVDPFPGADADLLYNAQHIKDLYAKADPNYAGRYAISFEPPSWIRHEDATHASQGSPSRSCGTGRHTRSSTMKAPKSSACSIPPSTTCFPQIKRPSISTPSSTAMRLTRSTNGYTTP